MQGLTGKDLVLTTFPHNGMHYVAVVTSLLKTSIFCFAPTRGTRGRVLKWIDVSPTLFAAAEDFPGVTYAESDRAIFLDNRGRYF